MKKKSILRKILPWAIAIALLAALVIFALIKILSAPIRLRRMSRPPRCPM